MGLRSMSAQQYHCSGKKSPVTDLFLNTTYIAVLILFVLDHIFAAFLTWANTFYETCLFRETFSSIDSSGESLTTGLL